MGKTAFDLRQFRENCLHLTQKELADLLGLRQDGIFRLEQNPDQITIPILVKLAELSGQSLDAVLNYKPVQPPGLNASCTWTTVQYNSSNIRNLLNEHYTPDSHLDIRLQSIVDELSHMLDLLARKPVLAVAGGFGSGKSTFINSITGQNLLPVSTQACISRLVRMRHIEDRPEGLESTVYLIRKNSETLAWDVERMNEPSYRESFIMVDGGPELIFSKGNDPQVQEILVYADSSVLRNCDIVRIPYPDFSNKSDDSMFINISFDMLAYLVPGIIDIQAESASYFRLLLERLRVLEHADRPDLGCLSNLFIVCSKAHLLNLEDRAKDRSTQLGASLYRTLPPLFWNKREQSTGISYSEKDFLSRCFFYAASDDPKWRYPLETALLAETELMPEIIRVELSQSLKEYRDTVCKELSDDITQQDQLQHKEAPAWISMSIPERKAAADQQKYRVRDVAIRCETNSINAFQRGCEQLLSTRAEISNDKQFIQQQVTELQAKIEQQIKEILTTECEVFLCETEKYLSFFGDSGSSRVQFKKSLYKTASPELFIRGLKGQPVPYEMMDTMVIETSQTRPRTEISTIATGGLIGALLGATSIIGAPAFILGGAALGAVSSISNIMAETSKTTSVKKIMKSVQAIFRSDIIPHYEKSIHQFWRSLWASFDDASKDMQDKWLERASMTAENNGLGNSLSSEQAKKDTIELMDFLRSLPL